MSYLLDTNVAWRRIRKNNPLHADVKSAIDKLVILNTEFDSIETASPFKLNRDNASQVEQLS